MVGHLEVVPLFVSAQIQAAVIVHHNCKTNLSMAYKEAGVVHFVQSGTPMVTDDGRPYVNKYSWCDTLLAVWLSSHS